VAIKYAVIPNNLLFRASSAGMQIEPESRLVSFVKQDTGFRIKITNAIRVFMIFSGMTALLFSASVHAETCKDNPKLTGACYTAHGRLRFYNGAPSARIWLWSEKRMLGVHDDKLPENLVPYADMNTEITGDYSVCPITPQKPHVMQMVCVQDVTHQDIHHRNRE
jgi:hypothetical protein